MIAVAEPAFEEFDKIARLSRECVITEKIDGTNGCIYIAEDAQPFTLLAGRAVPFMVGSRTGWIFPEAEAARILLKKTLEKDESPKGAEGQP